MLAEVYVGMVECETELSVVIGRTELLNLGKCIAFLSLSTMVREEKIIRGVARLEPQLSTLLT